MYKMHVFALWLFLSFFDPLSAANIWYNRPKLSSCASWDRNAITFANGNVIGSYPHGLFVSTNNTVYVGSWYNRYVYVLIKGNSTPIRSIMTGASLYSLFVAMNGNIYIDNGDVNGRVDKWTSNSTSGIMVMSVNVSCHGLFIDTNNTLYCSLSNVHKVVMTSLIIGSITPAIVAGNGSIGLTSNTLQSPWGIFVDLDFSLYVADSGNNRIQRFYAGQTNGTTVAGSTASISFSLLTPTGVVLDADGYLFITDTNNNRLIASSSTGFRCMAGCSGASGSTADKLFHPRSLAFDSYGGLLVTDDDNARVQRFRLASNSCALAYSEPELCVSASWNENAITFANSTLVGPSPYGIFINSNNTIYLAIPSANLIQIWNEQSVTPIRNMSSGFVFPYSVFETINGDIYIDDGARSEIYLEMPNGTNDNVIINSTEHCYGLFVDVNNAPYCSISNSHQVLKILVGVNSTTSVQIAGTGSAGSTATTLHNPQGIFVNTNLDLYVADCGNNRIQLFTYGKLTGTTVVGNGTSRTITLNCPTGVTLDANGYLFIVDKNNHRIVRSGFNDSHCVVGCSNSTGTSINQLNYPTDLAFDSYGNLFVVDNGNNRIQKFLFENGSCSTATTIAIQTSSSSTSTQLSTELSTSIQNPSTSNQQQSTGVSSTQQTSLLTSGTTASNRSCFPPVITLIPSTSSLTSPLQFQRSQDFSIASDIKLISCNGSLLIFARWTINICSTNCSSQLQLDRTIDTTSTEFFLPAKTLPYGTYQVTLTVAMTSAPTVSSSASAYVTITLAGITANLVQFGTSMITRGYQQNLTLNPGRFSIDPDTNTFNASSWKYTYYCRIYDRYTFPNIQGVRLTIDDPRIDPLNPSCLSTRPGNTTALIFDDTTVSPNSSLTILSHSFQSNQTYQFLVYMEYNQNSSRNATGYLLVQIVDTPSNLVYIACVISTLCSPDLEYHFVNPTTQVAVFSLCTGDCTSINNITWNIYHGDMNVSSNTVLWTPYGQMNQYENIWFFGSNTANFTARNDLFLSNSSIQYWRFEVVYSFPSFISTSALNLIINQPPQNGNCSISPLNGTTSTLFTMFCPNWFDQDGVKDYVLYTWTINRSQLMTTAFSSLPSFTVRLPVGDNNTSLLNLVVHVRDTLECVAEYNMSAMRIVPDIAGMNTLVENLQSSSSTVINSDPKIELLAGGNQNTVGQILTSLSQVFNQNNTDSLSDAVSNGVLAVSVSISSLTSSSSQTTSVPLNASSLTDFNQQLNVHANARDYLMRFSTNLLITTSNSIKLQASSLAQLTQATNQLTRTTATLASNQCYQLAAALNSMALRISYEDVLMAATDLTDCTNNVMSAINGPLQQRTSVLNLDASRANTFPQDYDTDLESAWSNLNLFADGNDFSLATIERNRNLYYQKQAANQIADQVSQTMLSITSALNKHLNIGQNMTVHSSASFMSLGTTSIKSLSSKRIVQAGSARIKMPSTLYSNTTDNATVSLRSTLQPLASAGQSSLQSNTNLSRSISLTVLDQNEYEVLIRANLTDPIELIIPRDPSLVIPLWILQNVTALNSSLHNLLFSLYSIDISSPLAISIHFEIKPMNTSLGYLFIYKFDTAPVLNSTTNQIDDWTLLCPGNLTNDSTYTLFIDNQKSLGHQSVIFGMRELNSTEITSACSNSSVKSPPITNEPFIFTSNYEMRAYTSGCYYLDNRNNWQSNGLLVGSQTDVFQTRCLTTVLAQFASGFFVLPPPINWNYVFSNADFVRNKTVYLTVILICVVFAVLLIYARYKDRKDLEKLGVTPLADNHTSDEYFYQILVFTGHRKNAGTQSKVYCILSGDQDDTQVRALVDPHRQIFQRSSIDGFIMAVPKSLGLLNYIRIWHDNSGRGATASWFLKHIIVRDLQTMEKFTFIAERWLAVEKRDGKIEHVLFPASDLEQQKISHLLSEKTYHRMSEDHLWLSIFSRPVSNHFTRVQRCTCCFVLLFFSMFLNIMYYHATSEGTTSNPTGLSVGSLHLSFQQIIIGVVTEVLSILPSILLIGLFSRLRFHRRRVSPLVQTLSEIIPHRIKYAEQTRNVNAKEKTQSKLTFPWWFVFVTYGLLFLLLLVSIWFILARGIEFGDLKTQKWLISSLVSFLASLFLIQPIKVLCMTVCCVSINRKKYIEDNTDVQLDVDGLVLSNGEEHLHSLENGPLFIYRPQVQYIRLTAAEVSRARKERLKEIRLWSIIQETLVYVGYLLVLFMITYSNRNQNAFNQVHHLRKVFLNTRQSNREYSKISTVTDYWNWLENSFVSNLRAQQWYNGDAPRNLSGFISDRSNRFIGWATMRQLRIKSSACATQKMNTLCKDDYSFQNEEQQSFQPGWTTNHINVVYNSAITGAFLYQTRFDLNTYMYVGDHASYSGNGYVYEFRGSLANLQSNLSVLHQLGWIDTRTRAVIIQMSLYNPNSQLFTSVTLLTEFLSTGGIVCGSLFDPIHIDDILTSPFQVVCTVFFIGFAFYLMCMQLRLLFQLKSSYFKQIWTYIELGIVSCSLSSLGVYIWRHRENNRIGDLFKQTNGYIYINLQLAAYVDNLLTFLLGFCCFFGTIKLLRLFRFNQRLSLFNRTLKHAKKELLSFACMFSVVFMAFVTLFYLLFVSYTWTCASLLNTVYMFCKIILMNFDTRELSNDSPFLGPFCFALFILIVVFVCSTMFITIIIDNFSYVRTNGSEDDYEILSFMFHKFQHWVGERRELLGIVCLKKRSDIDLPTERDGQVPVRDVNLIEDFPNRIDQLLNAINRIYVSQRTNRI